MTPKDPSVSVSPGVDYAKELEELYERRTALESLIRHLEQYDLTVNGKRRAAERKTA